MFDWNDWKETKRGRGSSILKKNYQIVNIYSQWFIQTKWSELALLTHSILREVEKMGYKKFSPVPI